MEDHVATLECCVLFANISRGGRIPLVSLHHAVSFGSAGRQISTLGETNVILETIFHLKLHTHTQ